MINTYHFYLNSAFNCERNKDIFRICYMTSRAIDPVPESARVEKRTVVESLAKFIVLASEISRIIVEAVKVLENIVLCYSESSRELLWNVVKFATNFFANFRAKVRENKERNSRILFALLFHNTVSALRRLADNCFLHILYGMWSSLRTHSVMSLVC